jgi:hypothetical protein
VGNTLVLRGIKGLELRDAFCQQLHLVISRSAEKLSVQGYDRSAAVPLTCGHSFNVFKSKHFLWQQELQNWRFGNIS